MARIERLQALQERYRKDAAAFSREIVGFEPDPWQLKVFADLSDPTCKKISVRSGQGVGKTGLEAVAVLWFLSCFPYSRVVATAPTRQQLNDVLWAEVAKWQTGSPLLSALLRWTKTYVYVRGMEKLWFATAKTAAKPENMQGFHKEHMLFVVDEASGVADPIMEAILGTVTGPHNILLLMGNPNFASGIFYDSHMNPHVRDMYRRHHISSRDVERTDKELIAAYDAQYGRDSNFVRVRIDGEFPLAEDDVFIPISLIQRSVMTEPVIRKHPATIDIAADVARFGDDTTVIGYKVDEKVDFHLKLRGQDTMRTAAEIAILYTRLAEKYRDSIDIIPVKIDDSGLGGGVTDRLRQIKASEPERYAGMCVVPVIFGEKLKNSTYYDDTTTLMMATVRNLLSTTDEKGAAKDIELILPNDEDLIAQLSTRKYILTDRSRIKIESKKEMKKRNLPSPDEADCLCMLCLPVDRDKARRLMRRQQR